MHTPRHLLALFLLITLAPAALLLVFGWRMLRQDQENQVRQISERREQLADLAVSSLRSSLDTVALLLANPDSIPPASDSTVVVFTPAAARGKLLFYPFTIAGKEVPAEAFAEGEQIEYRNRDAAGAAAWYANLARSTDPAIRTGALLGQARNLRRAGQMTAAQNALAAVVATGSQGVTVKGVPADLFARWAICDLLETLLETSGRNARELPLEATKLRKDLVAGLWKLDRATFDLYLEDSARWMGGAPPVPPEQLALAEAAAWAWSRPGTAGSDTVTAGGRQMTIVWRRDGDRFSAWIAGPDYAREHWLANLPGVQLNGTGEVQRAAASTGLPWTITMEADASPPGGRQSLWIAGLLVIALLVVAGTYVIARAASRELAVARLQSDFVAAVSHEFRTPLTSLRQLTEVLRDQRVASEDRRQTYYDAMARQTERLHQLVESLLDFGRMEAGRSPYRLQPLDARAWVSSVVEQFGRENAERGYQVDLDLNGTDATIAADAPALTNALWNLLENAVKYSPECRTVWVRAERDASNLAVRVRDRGLGIPHAEQKEIFRKFVRGAGAKHLGIQGTGIGLAMVEHIVKAHGGEVRVESEPGAGSTFTMLLPCHES